MGKNYYIVASRGRNPDNPSDRRAGIHTVQRLEPNREGICNALTTVLKDNYLAEEDDMGVIRIRKLTPTECYKLMGFDAADCEKVSASGISNAQLYKQAGNSIVVNVLEAIFTELGKTYDEFKTSVHFEEVLP